MSSVSIAAAPASFSLGMPGDRTMAPAPDALLEAISSAGYTGTELPPPGTFGTPLQLAKALSGAGLVSVGAYVPLELAGDATSFACSLNGLRTTLEELHAAGPSARVVLADAGGPDLQQRLAYGADEPRLGAEGWSVLIERVGEAVSIAAESGATASFHHHLATHVETVEEIDRLLDSVPVNLTLDTAHLALVGADLPAMIRRHAGRIDHVHLKDADPAVLARVQDERRPDFLGWWPTLFTPLGRGALDIKGAIAVLLEVGYTGWFVVEQDRTPFPESELERVVTEERSSLKWLEGIMAAAADSAER